MRRREFMVFLGGAISRPLAARAQQSAMPVVGYFDPGLPEQRGDNTSAFRKGLSEAGFVEGRNVTIEFRFARNDPSRVPELMADLVRRGVSVIAATGGDDGVLAAKAATATIPIVFEVGGDPVETGIVASFSRPGGNITGITGLNRDLDGKKLSLLMELVPAARCIGVLTNSLTSPGAQARLKELPTVAAALGRQIELLHAPDSRQLDQAFAGLAQKKIEALYVAPSPIYDSLRGQIVAAVARLAIPAIYSWRSFVDAGGLISYGADQTEDWRLVGTYVGRILKGEKPGDLPVLQPSKFELVINRKTAGALGLTLPPSMLAIADEVIE
jgi:putative ABC transport system substrate-binding protein